MIGDESMSGYLVCLDMDRVLVDHLSTWQFVYDKLGISNDESFSLYNQGLLDEWEWIKLDLALIKSASEAPTTDEALRSHMEGMPMMKGWRTLIQHLLDLDVHVAIVSGGLQKTARDIAAEFPSRQPWRRRWGGIDRHTSRENCGGMDSKLHVFTNGWLVGSPLQTVSISSKTSGATKFKCTERVQSSGCSSVDWMFARTARPLWAIPWAMSECLPKVAVPCCSILGTIVPRSHAHHVIEEKDLHIVLDQICDSLGLPKP